MKRNKKTIEKKEPQSIKRSVYALLLFSFSLLLFVSLLPLSSGSFGLFLKEKSALYFGHVKWFIPFLLAFLSIDFYKRSFVFRNKINYFFILLSFLLITLLLHLFYEASISEAKAISGLGGGYLGHYLSTFFKSLFGFWGSLLVSLSSLLLLIIIIFKLNLSDIVGRESYLFKNFQSLFKSDGQLEEYDEVEPVKGLREENIIEKSKEDKDSDLVFSKKSIAVNGVKKGKAKSEDDFKANWKTKDIKIDIPLELLSVSSDKAQSGDINQNLIIIQRTLENFGISIEMGDVNVGPTVTQYTFKPSDGIKLSKITTLSSDLSLSLAAHPIRIEAPIPGKSLVGIEVPNKSMAMVGLRSILEGEGFVNRKSNLMAALGKDVSGSDIVYDIAKMPHLLVAGATNSGKSVCLNALIVGLLYQNDPQDLRFIMVDPKRVEFPVYNNIPHLLTPVITDVPKTVNALRWCLNEMDKRYEILNQAGKKNIQSYNESSSEKLPYIVFIIDELADLMISAAKEIESSIIRLTQMSRAVGIHLILATQRPSVDVITGLIKANTPSRIAFSVASAIDSKTILDMAGAEKLIGKGDMLFSTAELSKPKRIQGAFLSDAEIIKITDYIKKKYGEADYLEGIVEKQKVAGIAGMGINGGMDDEDELLDEAREIVVNTGKASTSLLQRKLRIGYSRAASILDMLEESGVVGPSNGSKPREILISKEEYQNNFNSGVSSMPLHDKAEAKAPDNYLYSEEESPLSLDQEEEEKKKEEEEEVEEEIEEDESEDSSESKKEGSDEYENFGKFFSK